MSSIAELLAEGRGRLSEAAFSPPAREATLLLGRVLGWSEAEVLARSERRIPDEDAAAYRALLDRRIAGEPVAYLFGEREFYGRPFRVDRRVLIPRPETEHVVEVALALPLPSTPRILDLGTGSGCLAVTLALELDGARVTAVDLSPSALAVARSNAARLGASVALAAADLTRGLEIDRFDLVVANPPYIDPGEAAELSPEILRYEPHGALFASEGGLAVIRSLLGGLEPLRSGAWVAIEIGKGQAQDMGELAARSGLSLSEVRADLAGIPRVAVLRRSA